MACMVLFSAAVVLHRMLPHKIRFFFDVWHDHCSKFYRVSDYKDIFELEITELRR